MAGRVALDVAVQDGVHQALERVPEGEAALVREQQRGVHDRAVDDLETAQVVLEPVPDQDRLGADEAQQVPLDALQRPRGALPLQVLRRDPREAGVVVHDLILRLDEGVVDEAAVQGHDSHLGDLQAVRRVAHFAVERVHAVVAVRRRLLPRLRLHVAGERPVVALVHAHPHVEPRRRAAVEAGAPVAARVLVHVVVLLELELAPVVPASGILRPVVLEDAAGVLLELRFLGQEELPVAAGAAPLAQLRHLVVVRPAVRHAVAGLHLAAPARRRDVHPGVAGVRRALNGVRQVVQLLLVERVPLEELPQLDVVPLDLRAQAERALHRDVRRRLVLLGLAPVAVGAAGLLASSLGFLGGRGVLLLAAAALAPALRGGGAAVGGGRVAGAPPSGAALAGARPAPRARVHVLLVGVARGVADAASAVAGPVAAAAVAGRVAGGHAVADDAAAGAARRVVGLPRLAIFKYREETKRQSNTPSLPTDQKPIPPPLLVPARKVSFCNYEHHLPRKKLISYTPPPKVTYLRTTRRNQCCQMSLFGQNQVMILVSPNCAPLTSTHSHGRTWKRPWEVACERTFHMSFTKRGYLVSRAIFGRNTKFSSRAIKNTPHLLGHFLRLS